ncbi:MAG: pyridoxal-phosphate dependent enzyme [Acidobacteria bacterium]|nr:MAG: pyridoxal-phosphate dependent enzyme [Acidobacteriota bacterium]
MSSQPTRLVCAACGYEAPADDPFPFRCPRAGTDDGDHVLRRLLDPNLIGSPEELREIFLSAEENPFIRYRRLFHSYWTARSAGLSDSDYQAMVRRLDEAIAGVEGKGMRETPFQAVASLGEEVGLAPPGAPWIKDETGNVAGSHKARHLVGVMLWLEVARRSAIESGAGWIQPRLSIASCGNAALAAAVVAKAAEQPLDVFVPPDADAAVLELLGQYGARITSCPREETEGEGDPCYRRFREAVAEGALPFTCQGSENGLTIEGGETLVWEMVSVLLQQDQSLDHLVVQVGGGALASSCIQAFREAWTMGLVERLPRIHTVQTEGAFPLRRAWDRLAGRILRRCGENGAGILDDTGRLAAAEWIHRRAPDEIVTQELCYAATHRSEFMWPWEEEPKSLALGILDDETYDWLAVVEGMLTTGGVPVVTSESVLQKANDLARSKTDLEVDPTGSAGLAGARELGRLGALGAKDRVAVLFTGVSR